MYAINGTAFQQVTARAARARSRPQLRLVPAPERPARRRSRAVFWRRRVLVLLMAVTVAMAAKALVAWSLAGPEPLPAAPGAPPAPGAAYVVKHGDTLWEIGRALQPRGDVRPLVDGLARRRGGEPLRVGERIALP